MFGFPCEIDDARDPINIISDCAEECGPFRTMVACPSPSEKFVLGFFLSSFCKY